MNLNRVVIAGNLTRDPELRFTPRGTAVTKIGIAVNRVYTTEGGEKKEEVTFVDCECFGKIAELIGQYFKRGRAIYIEGRLRMEQWEDKATGQKKSRLGVVADSFQFCDVNREQVAQQRASKTPPVAEPANDKSDAGSDVPF